ncbi:hypothetical protein [Actinomadura gamaensis]|uniref:Uncharacterized protein n=1 Tax=Actinomadura gamaensis TaxID=1763541 RepID=A0ABV9U449_9ACTN
MVEMFVRHRDPVGGEQLPKVEVIVSRILVPGPEEGARGSEPRVGEQAERPRVHRDSGMSEKGDLGHTATVPAALLARTHRNAQGRYAEGTKEMTFE